MSNTLENCSKRSDKVVGNSESFAELVVIAKIWRTSPFLIAEPLKNLSTSEKDRSFRV